MNVDNATLKNLTAKDQNVGAYLLTTMANGFGVFGKYLLGIIVCTRLFNNCCGLIVSVSQYFNRIFPKVSYKAYTIFFYFD